MDHFFEISDFAPVDVVLGDSYSVDQGAAASAAAEEAYQHRIVSEARAIVAGDLGASPTQEHLRVLLDWLDGAQSHPSPLDEAPF